MPILVTSGLNSTQLTALARGKATKECQRPEYELRLLLAHIRILDQLEHSAAEMAPPKSLIEQKRPEIQQQHESSDLTETDDLEDLFVASSTLAVAASSVTVQELELDSDEWDA